MLLLSKLLSRIYIYVATYSTSNFFEKTFYQARLVCSTLIMRNFYVFTVSPIFALGLFSYNETLVIKRKKENLKNVEFRLFICLHIKRKIS